MKKETLKQGDLKPDDELNLDSGDLNFDFTDPALDKKRDAASPVKDGIKDAARNHLTQDRNIRRYIGRALPKEYADVFDTYTSVRDEASGAIADVKKVTQKPVNDFAKLIKEKVSDKHKRTRKALDWLIDKTDEYQFSKFDQRKADEDTINIGMGELQNTLAESFAKQSQLEEERRAEDADRRNLEMANDAIATARQTKLLNTLARNSDILAKTEMGFNLAEKKKSLELRYRIAFGIRDLVIGQKELTEVTRAHLKAIQHNTGLPDAQKLMISERFHNTIKNKFVNSALGQFGPEGFAGKAMQNFRERARQTAQDVGDAVSMAHQGVDMFTQDGLDFDDLSPEERARKKRAKMLSSIALDAVGPAAVGKVAGAVRKRSPGLEKLIQRGASKAGYAAQNIDSIAKDFAYGGDASEGAIKQGMRGLVEMMLPSRDNDNKLRMASGDALFEPGANGSQATTRALVEVIPGLLARILQEHQIQRTGNTKQGLAHFDYASGVFRYSSDMKDKIQGSMIKSSTSDMVLDNLMKTLKDSGADLDQQDQTRLKRHLMSSRMSGATITPERLMDPSFFKNIQGQGTADRLSGAFRKHFESSEGKFKDSDSNLKKRYELISTINTAVANASDPRAIIQQAVSEGHAELLREMGWINENGSINLERAYTFGIGGEDAGGKDTSVWKPAQGRASRRQSRQTYRAEPQATSFVQQPAAPSPSQQQTPGLSTSLLEALIKGQATQSEWLEKIEHNTAQPVVVNGGGSDADAGSPGFMDRSVRSHMGRAGARLNKMRKGAWNWMTSKSPLMSKAKDALAGSWAAGARKFKNFQNGLPDLADLYVYGSERVRITKAMFESQTLVDAQGKIIASLKDLVESVGDIKDQAGNVILTEGEKVASYLKSDGITFTKTWMDRIGSFIGKGMKTGEGIRKRVTSTLSTGLGLASGLGKAALSFGMELLQPAQDVYVMGEDKPRLLGYLMRQDAYFDQKTGDAIKRPTDIKGAVVDAAGQVLLAMQDLQKGIVGIDGKPFKTLVQKAADRVRTNIANTRKAMGMVLNFGKKAATGAFSVLKGLKTGIGKFMSFGMSGFKSGGASAAANAAAQSPEAAASMNVILLTQIRDILAEKLGSPGGPSNAPLSSMFAPGSIDPVDPGQATPEGPQTNNVGGTPINPMGMIGGLFSAATNGIGKLGTALRRRKGFLGKAGGFLSGLFGGGGQDTQPQKQAEQPQNNVQKQSRMAALKEKVQSMRERSQGNAKPTLNDLNGDGVRENSVIDKLRNKTNKNSAANARGGNREAQKLDTENAVDFVMGKLAAAKGLVGSLISGAADLFSMGGGKGKIAGKAGRMLARGGMIRGAAAVAGKGAMVAGKWALTKAIPFIAMRAIPAVIGAVGAALSSPVIVTAAAVAAVGGLAWWGYKTLYKDNKVDNVKDAASLNAVRMAEYGFGLSDTLYYAKLNQLEKVLQPAIVKSDKGVELDKSKIPAQDVLSIFNVNEEEPTKVQALLTWIERRFKPTYLKWQAIASNLNKPLEKLEDEDKPVKLKILESIEMNNTGWNEKTNPFGMDAELTMGPKEIKALIAAAKKLLAVEAKRGKGDAKSLAEETAKSGAKGSAAKTALAEVDGKIGLPNKPGGNKTLADKLGNSAEDKAIVNAAFKTGGLEALPGQKLDALTSIKLRAYGIESPTTASVMAINALEKAASPFITVDKNGSSSAQLDIEKLYDAAGKYFGVSKNNPGAYSAWRDWVSKRFMPVFTTYRANLQFHTGVNDPALAHRSLTATQTAAIAHQLVAVPDIWSTSLSGWPNKPGLADASSCDVFVKHLDEIAKKAVLQEVQAPRAPSPSEGQAKGYAEQRYDGMPAPDKTKRENPYMQKTLYKPPAPPDGEAEPKSGSTGGGKPSTGSMGSIPLAPGEIATGNAADQFIKLKKGANLDGMNPELLKLFRGMAEEYGTLTGKQISVNSGSRDFDQQMALYKANPSKAAKPGGSLHEKGLALDIDTATANELERLGLMKKYGFTRPVGGETWHIEPAGIQTAISQAKNDPNFATKAILESPGLGGGGAGLTKTSFAFGRRSTEIAVASMKASGNEVKGNVGPTQVASGIPGSSSSGNQTGAASGYAASVQNVKNSQTPSAITEGSGAGAGAYAAMPQPGDRQANMQLVREAAKAVGVDPNVALTTTALESSFKSDAAAGTSSAKGLNQFTSGTWSDMMKRHAKDYGIPPDASPNDPRANALLGAQLLKTNLQTAQKRGMPADIVQAYLMHFLGAGGANTFNKLGDNDIVADAMPQAAASNKPTFYDQNGKARTKAEMLAFITNKIGKAAKDFGIDLGSAAPSAGYSAAPQMASNAPTGPSNRSAATQVSDRAAKASTDDFSQAYQAPRQMAPQPVRVDNNKTPQTQSFDKIVEAINAGQDTQTKQLTALNGILEAVNIMAQHLAGAAAQSQTNGQGKESQPERAPPGSNVRPVGKPLVDA